MPRSAPLLTTALLLAAAPAAAAPLRIDKLEKLPSLDGVPGEWPRELGKLGATKGTPSAADCSGKAAVAYDDKDVYVAVDVTDDVFKGGAGGDKVEVVLIVGSQATTVALIPGNPGKSAGKATVNDTDVKGAKVVEAPRKGGWTLEAKIPWSAFSGASTLRVGLRGGVFVHDVDAAGSVDAIIGTNASKDASSLPAILTTPEQALNDGLVKDKRLGSSPAFQGTANVVGDGMLERVLVFDHYLVVLGPTFRKGTEYYYADMNVAGSAMKVLGLETRDLDGDGRHDLVFRKRFTKSGGKTSRDVMQVQSFGTADTPELVFQHEIGITNPKGSVVNEVGFSTEGNTTVITVRPGSAKGLDESNYDEPREASFDGVLLPWGTIESQTYKWKGKGYAKASEKTRPKPAGAEPTPKAPPSEKPAPQPAAPDTTKVYALYKKDRGISGSPRFDVSGDVEGDAQIERVVVHDAKTPELAVFGPGHKKGSGYSFTTLPFASGSDIKQVSLRDATGDKKAEIVVRGILKAKGPKNEEVEREIELVYRVSADGVRRVFGAEVGRAIGKNKIIGSISYESQKSGASIVLAAGKAVGFTKETYPFNQDTSAVGGLEPLILPWSETKSARYKWSGSGFEKQ